MTDTPHNDVKEAIQDAIARTAIYRGIALCLPAITTTDTYVTHDDGSVTGRVFDTSCPPSQEVKALIDAWLDGTALPPLPAPPASDPPPSDPPADPPPSDPPPSPPSNDSATHVVVVKATDKLGRVFTARATVGNDPTVPAIYLPLMGPDISGLVAPTPTAPLNTGNVPHPGLRWKFYADCCEGGAIPAGNAFDWLGFELEVTYDGVPVPLPPSSRADGLYDFPCGCMMPAIRYGAQVDFDPARIDWSLYPNFDRTPQPLFDDSEMDYSWNGLGCASTAGMGDTGDRGDIGYASIWSLAFLLNPCANSWGVIRRCGDHDGKWTNVFYCDDATGGILDVDTYPGTTTLSAMQRPKGGNNPIALYRGSYEGDTLTAPTSKWQVSCGNNHPNTAHLTDYGMLPAMITGTARDKDHASFWANYPLIADSPSARESGGIVMNAEREFAWCLRNLFMGGYVSNDPDYFQRHTARQLEIAQAATHAPFGLFDVHRAYNGSGSAKGCTGMAIWQHNYLALTLDAVSHKLPEWLPFAQTIGQFVVTILATPQAPLGTVYNWMTRDASGNFITDLMEQCRMSLVSNGWSDDDAAALTAPDVTAEGVYDMITAHVSGWTGKFANGVCDFIGSPESATDYPAEMAMGAAAALNAGVPGAEAAWAYVQSLPTKPDYSRNQKFHLVPRAA